MDYIHANIYNDLLTRKCACGGTGKMLCDFVADFVVRCSNCHLSTHAYIGPENAAAHWNTADDIMPDPLEILLDDINGNLQGDVIAIRLCDDREFLAQQSCDFTAAVIEYADKLFHIEADSDCISIDRCSDYNPKFYCEIISPKAGEKIIFDHTIVTKDKQIKRLEFRWNDTYLTIAALENTLVISRDIVPYGEVSPSIDGDYPLLPSTTAVTEE